MADPYLYIKAEGKKSQVHMRQNNHSKAYPSGMQKVFSIRKRYFKARNQTEFFQLKTINIDFRKKTGLYNTKNIQNTKIEILFRHKITLEGLTSHKTQQPI